VAIFGLTEPVLIFTPGVPDMAPNGVVRRVVLPRLMSKTSLFQIDGQTIEIQT
jgi:hypothetical protein